MFSNTAMFGTLTLRLAGKGVNANSKCDQLQRASLPSLDHSEQKRVHGYVVNDRTSKVRIFEIKSPDRSRAPRAISASYRWSTGFSSCRRKSSAKPSPR